MKLRKSLPTDNSHRSLTEYTRLETRTTQCACEHCGECWAVVDFISIQVAQEGDGPSHPVGEDHLSLCQGCAESQVTWLIETGAKSVVDEKPTTPHSEHHI